MAPTRCKLPSNESSSGIGGGADGGQFAQGGVHHVQGGVGVPARQHRVCDAALQCPLGQGVFGVSGRAKTKVSADVCQRQVAELGQGCGEDVMSERETPVGGRGRDPCTGEDGLPGTG
jgi:hypothetical protein